MFVVMWSTGVLSESTLIDSENVIVLKNCKHTADSVVEPGTLPGKFRNTNSV